MMSPLVTYMYTFNGGRAVPYLCNMCPSLIEEYHRNIVDGFDSSHFCLKELRKKYNKNLFSNFRRSA